MTTNPAISALAEALNEERQRAHSASEHEYERGLEFVHNRLVALAAEPARGLDDLRAALERIVDLSWDPPVDKRYAALADINIEARAALAAEPARGLDVERLARAMHGLANREAVGIVVEPDTITRNGMSETRTSNVRECRPEDHLPHAAAIAAEYARLSGQGAKG